MRSARIGPCGGVGGKTSRRLRQKGLGKAYAVIDKSAGPRSRAYTDTSCQNKSEQSTLAKRRAKRMVRKGICERDKGKGEGKPCEEWLLTRRSKRSGEEVKAKRKS